MVRFSAGRGLLLAAALIGLVFVTQPVAAAAGAIADVQGALDWCCAQSMIKVHFDANKIADFRYAIEAPATTDRSRSGRVSQ